MDTQSWEITYVPGRNGLRAGVQIGASAILLMIFAVVFVDLMNEVLFVVVLIGLIAGAFWLINKSVKVKAKVTFSNTGCEIQSEQETIRLAFSDVVSYKIDDYIYEGIRNLRLVCIFEPSQKEVFGANDTIDIEPFERFVYTFEEHCKRYNALSAEEKSALRGERSHIIVQKPSFFESPMLRGFFIGIVIVLTITLVGLRSSDKGSLEIYFALISGIIFVISFLISGRKKGH